MIAHAFGKKSCRTYLTMKSGFQLAALAAYLLALPRRPKTVSCPQNDTKKMTIKKVLENHRATYRVVVISALFWSLACLGGVVYQFLHWFVSTPSPPRSGSKPSWTPESSPLLSEARIKRDLANTRSRFQLPPESPVFAWVSSKGGEGGPPVGQDRRTDGWMDGCVREWFLCACMTVNVHLLQNLLIGRRAQNASSILTVGSEKVKIMKM